MFPFPENLKKRETMRDVPIFQYSKGNRRGRKNGEQNIEITSVNYSKAFTNLFRK